MAMVVCPECANTIPLDPFTYWDVEEIDVKCYKCKALLSMTFENGKLKRIEVKVKAEAQ